MSALDAFLNRPLVARLATNGPSVRPVWYLWEEGAFWIITGRWSTLGDRLVADDTVALLIDSSDLRTGEVIAVYATGRATLEPYDEQRAGRKLARYLGPDMSTWDRERFGGGPAADGERFIRLVPDRLSMRDLSFRVTQPTT